ncbi:MAG TPA: MFS transporter [Acidimicrobiales bacterium]|nr:MFS transporter [Acidimicrobiales bacterium]
MVKRIRERLERDTGGVAIFALVVLSLLYFFDEFDTAAFGVLAPDIQRSFHLDDQQFGALIILNVSLLLLLAIPVGHLADRLSRTRLVVFSGVIAGVFSFGTGLAGSVALLTVMRFGNGIGLLANGPIHNSLLADYYPVENRATVFGDHINALYLGAIAGPAFAGTLGGLFGWRAPFLVLMIPILVTTYYVRRLKEPLRGGTDDPAAALVAEQQEHLKFRAGVRALWQVRTLRRQFIGSLFGGAGLLPLAFYVPLYLERVYHLGPFWRGAIGAMNAGATFFGIQRSSRWTAGWFAKGMGEPLRRSAYCFIAAGVGLSLYAAAPSLAVALVIGLGINLAIGFFQPPFYAIQALVSPARARTLSFSFGALFLVFGVVFLFYGTGMGSLSDKYGIRWGVFVLGPYWVVAGLILKSAAKFVADDAAAALAALTGGGTVATEAASPVMLRVHDLDVAYDQTQVLFGVDLEVAEGEIVALLGTNGAGKSTVLKAISGLLRPTRGGVFFDGTDITRSDPNSIARIGITQVPGGRGVFPGLTVTENLRAASWLYRKDREYVREATARVLEYFPALEGRLDTPAGSLSGGEQQMLSLAKAFIARPRLLMIDELSLGLAPTIVESLLKIVQAIHENGTTILLVEQSVSTALRLATRAVFLEKGEVRFEGSTKDLLARSDLLRAVYLKGSGAGSNGNGAPARARKKTAASAAPSVDAPQVLAVDGVAKRYGGVRAVDSVSLELREGEVLGLIGPNGAGKTTLLDLISGFIPVDEGRVTLGGEDVTDWPAYMRARAGVGRTFQDARLWPSLTVREVIAASMERQVEMADPLSAAFGIPLHIEAEGRLDTRVDDVVELLALGAFRDKFVAELSTGSRRMVELACLLANRAPVLLLDEPSSGIAQKEAEALGPVLKAVQRHLGASILIIEHDMPLLTSIADRLVALEAGAVVASGRPDDVLRHPRVVAAYLGGEELVK